MRYIFLVTLYLLTGCGFKPLHDSSYGKLNISLGSVQFKDTLENELVKFHFKRALEAELSHNKHSPYRLDLIIESEEIGVNVQSDYYSYRLKYNIVAHINLYEAISEKLVFYDRIVVTDSYEVGSAPITGHVAKERVGVLLAKNLAKLIYTELHHFSKVK